MGQLSDWNFINYVKKELRAGKSKIDIPSELLLGVSDQAMKEAQSLVKLSGAKITSVRMNIDQL